ncbi:MAG: hypothetical protein ACQEWU_14275 [Bacillota bacterium]|uniref:Uncharacterized protein n=1 Tax=Virgibacillus salarius TaxID=447199 RepID=A0A941DSI7_9BACI|nr:MULTISPECIES: hypothetical protein [Virgibacillus]NAZ09053.1 hypothetical protein [Agaribacter marinus]MBR7796344.1 hypothetical protein [Virgibacillus salarius]MCC2251823.1 hypothetical protein [Virgibacillus sp. AGTR]MDY7044825.1 hypothetical protein [Virgibacillus sp. M23]QRZ16303.1 hypothetical protein JUJ52_10700 [Virgibacillus sp. AGTR]
MDKRDIAPNILMDDPIMGEIHSMVDEIMIYAIEEFHSVLTNIMENMRVELNVSDEWMNRLYDSWLCWTIFCFHEKHTSKTIYQQFLQYNREKWIDKSIAIQKLLYQWNHLKPGIYVVGSDYSIGENYTFIDIVEGKVNSVILRQRKTRINQGDMVIGFLLPYRQGHYLSIGKTCLIPNILTNQVSLAVLSYFSKHAASSRFTESLYPALSAIAIHTVEQHL